MKLSKTIPTAAALFAFCSTIASAAQTPPPTLIKLPNGDYTVPMSELQGSGVHGKATFHPQGMKTLVTVYAYGANRKHNFMLHTGKNCSQLGVAGARNLNPAFTGQPSQTLVSLPIDEITSNYVVAAADATAQTQYREACGHF